MKILSIFAALALACPLAAQTKIDYPTQIQRTPAADPRTYTFIVSPGGSLSAGPNSVTMRCPAGVGPGDQNHWLYVTGGTGAAEVVLITGGSGSAGNPCVLQFTTGHTHSGAFTIQSATSGGQEAANATPNGAVQFPAGTFPMYAPLTLSPPVTAQTITCASWGSILLAESPTADMIDLFSSNPSTVIGCTFSNGVARTAGSAIQLGNGTTDNSFGARIDRNQFIGQYNAFAVQSGGFWHFTNNNVGASNYGMIIRNMVNGDQGDDVIVGNEFAGFGGLIAGVRWESGGGFKFLGNKIVSGSALGIDMVCTALCTGDILIVGNSIEGMVQGIRVGGPGTFPIGHVTIGHNEIGVSGPICIGVSGASSGASVTEVLLDANDCIAGGIVVGANVSFIGVTNNILNLGGSTVGVDTSAANGSFINVAGNMPFGTTVPYAANVLTALAAPAQTYSVGITAASTILPPAQYFSIAGTTAINTITPPAWCLNGCTVTVIPTGLWTITNAGNVLYPAGTSSTTAIISKPLILTYYPGSVGRWYPSY